MARKPGSIEAKLSTLADIGNDIESGRITGMVQPIASALGDRSHIVAAKGAELCAALRHYDSIPELISSFERFLNSPTKTDKGCLGKSALIKALYELDWLEADFYRKHMNYRQMEPAWDSVEDVAIEIRSVCALGLAASNDHRAIMDLARLVNDTESAVRKAAIQAIGTLAPATAEAAIRQKVFSDEQSGDVLDECFRQLLNINSDECIGLVAEFLDHDLVEVAEVAAFCLGESRQPEALQILTDLHSNSVLPKVHPNILIQAIGFARTDAAADFLIELIKTGTSKEAEIAEKSLTTYGQAVQKRVSEILRMKS